MAVCRSASLLTLRQGPWVRCLLTLSVLANIILWRFIPLLPRVAFRAAAVESKHRDVDFCDSVERISCKM